MATNPSRSLARIVLEVSICLLVCTCRLQTTDLGQLRRDRIPVSERSAWQGEELVAVLGRHAGASWDGFQYVNFGPDGNLIFASGPHGIQMWDVGSVSLTRRASDHRVYSQPVVAREPGLLLFPVEGPNRPWSVQVVKIESQDITDVGYLRWEGIGGKALDELDAWDSWDPLSLSADERWLAWGLPKGWVVVWRLDFDAPVESRVAAAFQAHAEYTVNSLALSRDGSVLAAGTGDILSVWRREEEDRYGEAARRDLSGEELIDSAVFLRDDRLATSRWAVEGAEPSIQVWGLRGGQLELERRLDSGPESVVSLAANSTGSLLASGQEDGIVRLWDLTGEPVVSRTLRGRSPGNVFSIEFAPDDRRLAWATRGTAPDVWDLSEGRLVNRPAEGHTSYVSSLSFSSDGACLASADVLGVVFIWDLRGSAPRPILRTGEGDSIDFLEFSPVEPRVLAVSYSDPPAIEFYRLEPDCSEPRLAPLHRTDRCDLCWFSLVGGTPLFCLETPSEGIQVWDYTTWPPVLQESLPIKDVVLPRHLRRSSGQLAVYPRSMELRPRDQITLYDLTSVGKGQAPRRRVQPLPERAEVSEPFAFAPTSDRLAYLCSERDQLRKWNFQTGEDRLVRDRDDSIQLMEFLGPEHLVCVCTDRNEGDRRTRLLLVIDVGTGGTARRWTFPGDITSLATHDDGRHFAVGNSNGTIYIFRFDPPDVPPPPPPVKPGPSTWERRMALTMLRIALENYHEERGQYPATLEGLTDETLGNHYLDPPADPWGRPYGYEVSDGVARVTCLGEDGEEGGEGNAEDITISVDPLRTEGVELRYMEESSNTDSAANLETFGFPGQYDENGVDLSLIRSNLRLSPTERARRADRARRAALRVQEIGRASRSKPT